MAKSGSPEKAPLSPGSTAETRVIQPKHIEFQGLADILAAVEEIGKVAETMTEDTSKRDAGGAGLVTHSGGTVTVSARDRAIAHLPPPAIMQRELEKHIKEEVKKLRRQARSIARRHGPGGAYHLSKLYARIHQLHSLLASIIESGVEAVKRFFIRVFIDRQPIL